MKLLIVLRAFPPKFSPSGGLIAKLLKQFPNDWEIMILTEEKNIINNYHSYFVTERNKEKKYFSFVKRNFGGTPYEKKRVVSIKNKIESLDRKNEYDYIIAATPNEIVALTFATTKAKKIAISMEKLFNVQTLKFPRSRKVKEHQNEVIYLKMIQDFSKIFAFPMVYEKLSVTKSNNVIQIEHPVLENNVSTASTLKQMVYAGALDKKQRPPMRALTIVTSLCKALSMNSMWYGGGNGFTYVEKLSRKEPCIKCMGIADVSVIQDEYEKSDVLISIGNSDPELVPSKILEYISTGKTILHIANILNDPAKKYLLRYPKAIIVEDKYDIEMLVSEIEMKNSISLTYDEIVKEFGNATPECVAQTVVSHLSDDVMKKNNTI